MQERYWPFPVKPEAEWSDQDRDYIGFLRQAYAEGYRPRETPCISVEAEAPAGRSVSLTFRGHQNGWEPLLADCDQPLRLGPAFGLDESACVCVRPPFRAVAHLALEWLRGRELKSLLDEFVFVDGNRTPRGLVPRSYRLAFADFLDRLANGDVTSADWRRHAVAHYADDALEKVRREVVRLSIERESSSNPLSAADREQLRGWARELRDG